MFLLHCLLQIIALDQSGNNKLWSASYEVRKGDVTGLCKLLCKWEIGLLCLS